MHVEAGEWVWSGRDVDEMFTDQDVQDEKLANQTESSSSADWEWKWWRKV